MRPDARAIFALLYASAFAATTKGAKKDVIPMDTTFNGLKVPPMKEMNGSTILSDISKGNWLVETFSPYCHHCISLAPKYQTLYEFYYTSDPLPASPDAMESDNLNSFSRYYDFKFSKLDCVAFGTACGDLNVTTYPQLIFFRGGKEVKRFKGNAGMDEVSAFIEEVLEIIRPGSRPTGGSKLPEVGASGVERAKDIESVQGALKQGASKVTTKPKIIPNTSGVSLSLDADAFQKRVTKSLDTWFIKFYSPRCHHCQAMAPAWDETAREMRNKLNIGEVNCDVDKRLCRDVHIKAYPTILFFRGAERIEYDGLRGMGDFIDFAEKAATISNGVRNVTASEFEELEKTEEVIFVYFFDHATVNEDFEALERLPMHIIGHAKLVKTCDLELVKRFKISTWPRLVVSRDGKPTIWEALSPRDMRDVPKISKWMQSVWQPLVPELSPSNAREIMDGKYVVLGILSRQRTDEFIIAKREIKNAALEWMEKQEQAYRLERQELRDAKQLRIEEAEDRNDQRALRSAKNIRVTMEDIERKEVGFAWVDGVFWQRWIRTTYGISVEDGEKVIINDEDNRRYWDSTITGNPIVPSRTSILETVHKVVSGSSHLTPKATGSKISHLFFQMRSASTSHPWLASALLVASLISIIMFRRARRRSRGGFVHLDGKEGLLGGQTPNGKVD